MVRVYINNQEVDILKDDRVQIATTYSVSDIKEVDKAKSSISKTITLPATGRNKQIFGFADDIHSLNSFNNGDKNTGRIEVEGTTILEGSVKMERPIINGDKRINEFEIVIISGAADWKTDIGDKNIKDIDFSVYNHDYTLANQLLSETIDGAEGTLEDRFVVYPVVDYGEFAGNYSNYEIVTQDRKPSWNVYMIFKRIFNDAGFKIVSDFVESDFFKRLYILFTNDKLYRNNNDQTQYSFRARNTGQIFYASGYTVPSPDIEDMYAAQPTGKYLVFSDRIAFDDDSSSGYFDNNNNFTTSNFLPNITSGPLENYTSTHGGGYYTVPFDSKQRFVARLTGTIVLDFNSGNYFEVNPDYAISPPTTLQVRFSIVVNNTNKLQTNTITVTRTQPQPGITTYTATFDTKIETELTELSQGDIVGVHFDYVWESDQLESQGELELPNGQVILPIRVSAIDSSLTLDAECVFYNEFDLELLVGGNLDIAANLPDVEQIDFVKAVKHLFNLYFYSDTESREVIIEPRDQFYLTEAVNWIGKVDNSKKIEIEYLGDRYSRITKLRYKNDSKDFPVEEFEGAQGDGYVLASYLAELDNRFAEAGVKEDENKLFAPTLMDFFQWGRWKRNKVPKLWREFKDDEEIPDFSTDFEERIVYYHGIKSLSDENLINFWANTERPNDIYWLGWNKLSDLDPVVRQEGRDYLDEVRREEYPYMYSVEDRVLNDNSLYFETRDKSHGLFDKYYRNTYKLINEGRLVRCDMYLTPLDIANLDFRKPVIIELNGEPAYFTINRIIDYNPTKEGTTKVELVTAVSSEPLQAVLNTPDETSTNVIQFRVKKQQLQTNLNGTIVDVFSDISGNVEPVYEQ